MGLPGRDTPQRDVSHGRAGMKRTPLSRHAQLQRRTWIKAMNRERKAKRRAEGLVYGPYHRWVADESNAPCALRQGSGGHACGFFPYRARMEGHHLKKVGSGGKDAANEVRVCAFAHDLLEDHPGTMWAKTEHGVDLIGIALDLWARYQREQEGA